MVHRNITGRAGGAAMGCPEQPATAASEGSPSGAIPVPDVARLHVLRRRREPERREGRADESRAVDRRAGRLGSAILYFARCFACAPHPSSAEEDTGSLITSGRKAAGGKCAPTLEGVVMPWLDHGTTIPQAH